MLGIAIRCMQHSQAMVERGVCELAHSFFHYDCLPYQWSHDANACTDVESHYFVWLAVKFPNILKTTTWLLSPCVAKFSRSCVPVLITLQWSVTLRSAFYRGGKKSHFHIWGVFSFILMNIKLSRILYTCIHNIIHWVNISGFAIIDLWLNQGRSQELEMGGAKLLGEGSWGRLRPKGGCTCTCGTPPPWPRLWINTTKLYLLYQWSGNHLDKMINKHIGI